MKFTYDWYKNFINKAKENGYIFSSYTSYINNDKSIILRHDVDMSIDKALEMAIVESEMNVSSTYFFLLTSNFYNLFNKENKDKLIKIMNLGHQIGLHFDEKQYAHTNIDDLVSSINNEISLLQNLIKSKIEIYSNHRPSSLTINESSHITTQAKSAYSNEFFTNMKYFSDSRMNWREDFDKVIQESTVKKIQVCIHPIWYEDSESNIKTILNNFIRQCNNNTILNLTNNIRNFEDLLEVTNEI